MQGVGLYPAPVKVALYHPWIYLRGGAERTILELTRRSRNSWAVFTHHLSPRTTFSEFSEVDVVELEPRISVRRSFSELVRAAAAIATTRLPDVGARALLVSSESVGDFVLARNRLPAVCYCHTPLKILHDQKTRDALRQSDPVKSIALGIMAPVFEGVERRLWKRYAHIFVNSDEVRSRVVKARRTSRASLEVLHPGVDLLRFALHDEARGDFFLVPGRIVYWKNIELAIDAFVAARAAGLRSTLVVAGIVDEKSTPYLAALRHRAAGHPVSFETDVSDDRMATLMKRSLAVLFPSWNEDFGIIPLEAMAAGAPVLAIDRGGPRETIQNDVTGWLIEADPERFARRMLDIEAAPKSLEPMRRAASERAASFSWDHFAQRVDAVMEQVATGEPPPVTRTDNLTAP